MVSTTSRTGISSGKGSGVRPSWPTSPGSACRRHPGSSHESANHRPVTARRAARRRPESGAAAGDRGAAGTGPDVAVVDVLEVVVSQSTNELVAEACESACELARTLRESGDVAYAA